MKKQKGALRSGVLGNPLEMGFWILEQWLSLRQKQKNLIPFFQDNFIKTIAIYGMGGGLGKRLYEELQNSEIKIRYAIDRNPGAKTKLDFEVYGLKEPALSSVDAIVVTPVYDYWPIVGSLEMKTNAPILSLKDIVDYCVTGG
ncbi:MAG: hypothetical protein HFE75_10695 [Firmicutes bacterium]|nr:hypothetical protein [Bacillota bacterium]